MMGGPAARPVSVDQRSSAPSCPPVASILPPGWKAAASTEPLGSSGQEWINFPVAAFQSLALS